MRNLILEIYCWFANRNAVHVDLGYCDPDYCAYLNTIDYSDKTLGELDDGYDAEVFTCYQCEKETNYLFDDSRCKDCTRLTPEEVIGNTDEPCGYCGTSQNPNDICQPCFDDLT